MSEDNINQVGKKSWYKTWWGILLIVLGLLIILRAAIGDGGKKPQQNSQTTGQTESLQTETETTTVPFKKISQDDPTIPKGQTQITQPGTNGIKEITYQISGNTREKISEKIIVEPRDEITSIGTMIPPIQLSGSGQQASQKFTLGEGLSIFRMTHSGQGNFSIWLLDSNGEKVELLVNVIGSFNGSKAVRVNTPGEYVLDVQASGGWTVKIEQPRPTTAPSVPKTLSGRGQQASEFITLNSGLKTFKMKHTGQGNFGIWLLDSSGEKVELLVNEIGSFDGSKAIGISTSGIYILDISADGEWSVSIE